MGPNWHGSNFTSLFFKRILRIDILTISCEIGEWHRTPLMLINIGSGNGLFMPATEKQNSSSFIRILKQQTYFNKND